MTVRDLAMNWIENDQTGAYNRKITLEEAEAFVGWMDPDVIESVDEEVTPQAFMEAWNDIVN